MRTPPANFTPSTPGFDRTIIPPFTFRAARASKDDSFLPSAHEREAPAARRVRSLTVRGRGEAASLDERAPAPQRNSVGEVLERGRARAKRYSVPLRAAQLQVVQPPRPATAGHPPAGADRVLEVQRSQPLRGQGQHQAAPGRPLADVGGPMQAPEQKDLPPPPPPKDASTTPTARPPEA